MKIGINRLKAAISKSVNGHRSAGASGLQGEDRFNELLRVEAKRSERSKKTPLLMLLDVSQFGPQRARGTVAGEIASILHSVTREIDIKGWYKAPSIFGVLFTETERPGNGGRAEPDAMIDSVRRRVCAALGDETTNAIRFSCYPLSSHAGKPARTGSFAVGPFESPRQAL